MNAIESTVCYSHFPREGIQHGVGRGTQGSIRWARRQRSKEKMRANLHRGFHGKRTSDLGKAGLGSGQGG